MKAIQDIATGALIGCALVGSLAAPGCGQTVQVPPQVAQNLCRLDALKILPKAIP